MFVWSINKVFERENYVILLIIKLEILSTLQHYMYIIVIQMRYIMIYTLTEHFEH